MSARENPSSSATPHKKTILCIDDQPEGLSIRKIFLETFGYEVLSAASGREGLRLLEDHSVHVLVLDYRMREMDGEAVAIAVRSRWPELPIIMLSGFVAEVPSHLHSLINAFVSKGAPPSELLQALADVVGPLPKKPPARYSEYDLLQRQAKQQIECSRVLVAKNRDHLRAGKEKNRQG